MIAAILEVRELTGRIGDDSVEKRAASPGISRDVKGAQV